MGGEGSKGGREGETKMDGNDDRRRGEIEESLEECDRVVCRQEERDVEGGDIDSEDWEEGKEAFDNDKKEGAEDRGEEGEEEKDCSESVFTLELESGSLGNKEKYSTSLLSDIKTDNLRFISAPASQYPERNSSFNIWSIFSSETDKWLE